MPGITLEKLVSATDEEKQTFVALWGDIVNESKSLFYVDFSNRMLECHELILKKNGGCDYAKLICKNRKILHTAWKYRLATTFFEFLIYSSRLTRFTSVLSEQSKELRDSYQKKYSEALALAVRYIDVSEEDCCAPCGGNGSSALWLP